MDRLLLKLILYTRPNIKSALKFCKDRNICKNNKDIVAKKILSLAGYKIPKKASTTTIFSELYEATKFFNRDLDIRLRVTQDHINLLKGKISQELRAFLAYNKINVPYTKNELKAIFSSI